MNIINHKTIQIIGIGSSLLTDDSAGLYVIEGLQKLSSIPDHVILTNGGTGGIAIVDLLEDVDHLIIVDAFLTGSRPGKIFEKEFDITDIQNSINLSFAHGFDLATVLKLYNTTLEGKMPGKITIIGIEAQDIKTFSSECTQVVKESVSKVVDLILKKYI
ncbi:MAG: hydrogenase maturation protease [Desulfobacteraceae bacterium]|nr:hydrogenase maturation protease [Desulfobacteraceae bacterium]